MIVKFHFIKVKLSFVLVCCYGFWYSLFYNLLYCLGCLSFFVLLFVVRFYVEYLCMIVCWYAVLVLLIRLWGFPSFMIIHQICWYSKWAVR